MSWFYYFGRLVVKIAVLLFTRCEVSGRENVPDRGPLLVIANHLNLADPPLLGVCLRRRVTFMAKAELFRSRALGYFISSFGAFPVRRGQLDRKALAQAERVLAQELALIMFPEAMRSKNAQLQPAFPGSALIASRSGTSILPVAITGTERLKGLSWLLRRPRLTVTFGAIFHLPPTNGEVSKAELAELTNFMMGRIAELLPPEYRGNYV